MNFSAARNSRDGGGGGGGAGGGSGGIGRWGKSKREGLGTVPNQDERQSNKSEPTTTMPVFPPNFLPWTLEQHARVPDFQHVYLSLSLSLSVYVSGSCLSVCVFSVIYEYEEKKRKKKEERIVLCMNWILCIYDSNNYYLLFAVHGGFLLHWLELVWMTLWVLMTHMGMAIDFWFLIWILGVLDTKRMGSAQLTELTESICSKKKTPRVLALRHCLKGILVISLNFLSQKFIVILCVTWQILSDLEV